MIDEPGFAVCAGVFEREEMIRAIEALGVGASAATRAGARHVLRVPAVRALAHDPRLLALAARFVERLARELAAVDCLAPAGGVVAMRPLTIHASSKAAGARPRRIVHVEYADNLDLGRGVRLTPDSSLLLLTPNLALRLP